MIEAGCKVGTRVKFCNGLQHITKEYGTIINASGFHIYVRFDDGENLWVGPEFIEEVDPFDIREVVLFT